MDGTDVTKDAVKNAIIFAVEAHGDATRKGTSIPYILHPIEAAMIVASMTEDQDTIAATVLHDVLEDTDVTSEQISEAFGARVLELVEKESENKRGDGPAKVTWEERKQETIDLLSVERNPAVKMIALGDKLSNLRAIYNDYLRIGDRVWDRFDQKDKAKHCWYHASIRDAVSDLSEYPAWQEYDRLVEEAIKAFACDGFSIR
jgi:myo-inositol-1(or 4)-monophosphatase